MISLEAVDLGYSESPILENVSLQVGKGEFVGIIGLSGAGKTTLLMSMIGNIPVLEGRYLVFGHDLALTNKRELREIRSRIGFIFQGYNLVNRLSVFHNVMSGMLKDIPIGRSLLKFYTQRELDKAYEYMQVVGIEHLSMKRCDELSGGQRQRVAIARALAQEPNILLADEPVAALDPKSAAQVMDVLQKVNETYGVTVISNLHHLDFAREYCNRIIGVGAGTLSFDVLAGELQTHHLDTIYEKTTSSIEEDNVTSIFDKFHGGANTGQQEQNHTGTMPIAA